MAIGCNDGSLLIFDAKSKMKKSISQKKGAIICLDWDNHSPNYLLIGYLSGEIYLIDTDKMIIMQEFEKINIGKLFVI